MSKTGRCILLITPPGPWLTQLVEDTNCRYLGYSTATHRCLTEWLHPVRLHHLRRLGLTAAGLHFRPVGVTRDQALDWVNPTHEYGVWSRCGQGARTDLTRSPVTNGGPRVTTAVMTMARCRRSRAASPMPAAAGPGPPPWPRTPLGAS